MIALSEFHFIRPEFLLALLPAIILAACLWFKSSQRSAWRGFIDEHLIQFLLDGKTQKLKRWPLLSLLGAWFIACLALAGPSWQQLPQPVHQPEAASVILFDLSPSMMAEDIKPSRLVRTRFKIMDFLNARTEGLTALIAYAGEAHIVSPLTDDINTISNLLPALSPSMMPLPGSNVEMAVGMATQLFTDAGLNRGEILLVTDGVDAIAFDTIREQLQNTDFRLSVMGVGSVDGAPIPTGEGGFVRDRERNIIVAKLNRNDLQSISRELGGVYVDLRPDDRDVSTIVESSLRAFDLEQEAESEREFDVWLDQGQWLALLLIPFAAFAFRRGWLLTFLIVSFLGSLATPQPANAFEWRDLWIRKDQQGQFSLQEGDPAKAATEFEAEDWRGVANYRAENYEAAADAFAQDETALADFNRGNALAKAGDLESALEAYESAMEKQDSFEDAQFNHDLVKNLLEQQEQDNQNQQDEQQESDQDQQNQSAQNEQQESEDQENSEEQNQQAGQSQQQQQNQNDSQNGDPQSRQINEQAAQDLAQREQNGEELTDEELMQLQQMRQQLEQQQNDSDDESFPVIAENQPHDEDQQALEQWLRQVPDDPSGLMRRKFQYQRQRRLQEYQRDLWSPPENGALERW